MTETSIPVTQFVMKSPNSKANSLTDQHWYVATLMPDLFKSFSQNGNLETHMKVLTGERRYQSGSANHFHETVVWELTWNSTLESVLINAMCAANHFPKIAIGCVIWKFTLFRVLAMIAAIHLHKAAICGVIWQFTA